ncbi:MAG TPA: bifunctional DNA-formamidopyrimidine glycosylase/DNA-(apurinic or apyrimidinic site) lyase [Candidatus Paceibacterota bacterium]
MPELPEVHTTVEGLKGVIVGKTITDVWSDFHVGTSHGKRQTIKNKKYFEKFRKLVKGAKIKSVERRGKNILVHLSNDYTFIVHMKMTGHLMYGVKDKFVHLIFKLKNSQNLVLSDMRKFASVTFCKTEGLEKHETVGKLGPEPLSKSFSAEKLLTQLQKRKSWPIKSALLDQTVLAGIGNIYSDEILWEIGIHPLSHTGKIPKNKFGEMFKVMQKILRFSIKHGGDSKSDYLNAFGKKGNFQNFHKVYGKRKEQCPKPGCRNKKGAIIERLVVKGRSAHFCPKHQIKF